MAGHDVLDDLLVRCEGWEVVSALPVAGTTQVRLATPLPGDDTIRVRSTFFLSAGAPPTTGVVGGRLHRHASATTFGTWQVRAEEVEAGQLLDNAVIRVSGPVSDPCTDAPGFLAAVLERGEVLWPPTQDLPEQARGLGLLEGTLRQALTASALVVSVVRETPDAATWSHHTFTTPWTTLEVTQHDAVDGPAVLTCSPPYEAPVRVLERAGLCRVLGDGPGQHQHVDVRVTWLGTEGLTLGALGWDEDDQGRLVTSRGVTDPGVVASEVLSMLPGGDPGGATNTSPHATVGER